GVHREDRLSHPGRTDAVNPVLVNRYLLVGDVVDEVAKWCAEEVEYDIETYLEPDETLHLLIFLLKRHDKAKYGYLLDLFKAHYPEVEVPLFAKTYS
ncbi:hypothetical protein, partial [Aeromonas sanarellii]